MQFNKLVVGELECQLNESIWTEVLCFWKLFAIAIESHYGYVEIFFESDKQMRNMQILIQ